MKKLMLWKKKIKLSPEDAATAKLHINMYRKIFFFMALISAVACILSSYLHYTRRAYGNNITWISWLLSILFLLVSFYMLKEKIIRFTKTAIAFFIAISVFFIITHFINFKTAPWNQNGLFDDASWNIYFALKYIFSGKPFQAAFHDHAIAREVLFHYYITFAFKLFGYNLLVFNISVMLLGFVAFLFTALLIHELFKKYIITAISALILTFFPLHYLFSFVGQRYAIVPPLLMSSLFFTHIGFKRKVKVSVVLGGILGGLCVAGGIMGKQYLMALAAAVILSLIFNFKKSFVRSNWVCLRLFVLGFLIAAIPLIMYIIFNSGIYFRNESTYTNAFFASLRNEGFSGFLKFYKRMQLCLFGETYYKWFIPDYPIIPKPYYFLLGFGLVPAFLKKDFHFMTLAFIAPIAAFVSGFSDYRVLLSCPIWVILIAYGLNSTIGRIKLEMLKEGRLFKKDIGKLLVTLFAIAIVLSGLLPSIKYIYEKSKNPYSVYFFAQKDVALSRYIRDIVAGVSTPSTRMRKNEFRKLTNFPEPQYDTYVCQKWGYAITHTFLHDYDDRKILSFSDQLPYNLLTTERIFAINKSVVQRYRESNKDLKLIWEITEKTNPIIKKFKKFNVLGSDEVLTGRHEGREFKLYVLNIRNENIEKFKEKVEKLH